VLSGWQASTFSRPYSDLEFPAHCMVQLRLGAVQTANRSIMVRKIGSSSSGLWRHLSEAVFGEALLPGWHASWLARIWLQQVYGEGGLLRRRCGVPHPLGCISQTPRRKDATHSSRGCVRKAVGIFSFPKYLAFALDQSLHC